ncbi:MAG: hypothetical protein ACXVWF_05035 [Actinomycetota bacterium]
MAEPLDTDAAIRRFSMAAAVALSVAVIGIPYALERAFHRWQRGISPLAGLRTRLRRMRTHSEERREAAGALVGVARVVRKGRPG